MASTSGWLEVPEELDFTPEARRPLDQYLASAESAARREPFQFRLLDRIGPPRPPRKVAA